MAGYLMSMLVQNRAIYVSVGDPLPAGRVRVGVGAQDAHGALSGTMEVVFSAEEFAHWLRRMTEFVAWANEQAEYLPTGKTV